MEFVHPDDRDATRAEAAKVAGGNPVIRFENRYCHKDGTVRSLLWAAAPFMDQQLVYAAARDITDHKAAEELRARTANLELLDDQLTALVDSKDPPEAFGRICAFARKVVGHDAAALMVRIADGPQARLYASSGFPPGLPEVMDIPEEVLRNPNWEHDLLDDLRPLPESRYTMLVQMGFQSLLRVPVRLDERFAGALIFLSTDPPRSSRPTCLLRAAWPTGWRSSSPASAKCRRPGARRKRRRAPRLSKYAFAP
jgi:hypothetical protein